MLGSEIGAGTTDSVPGVMIATNGTILDIISKRDKAWKTKILRIG